MCLSTVQSVDTFIPNSPKNLAPEKKAALMATRLSAVERLGENCVLCPRACGINRIKGERGTCKTGANPVYSSVNLHFGEEPPISGSRGSGTIFFTGCNLNCIFCQNYPISQLRHGIESDSGDFADQMIHLQQRGAHNINLVTPTHQAAAIFKALHIAFRKGLNIPIVYNSGGYESHEMLRLWDGIIDVYMPDSKYADDQNALKFSNAPDYPRFNRIALKEMHRQVGDLETADDGTAIRGMVIRHLVLPEDLAGSEEVLRFIAEELSSDSYISLMSQYFPAWQATSHPIVGRKVNRREYLRVVNALERFGLKNGWTQPLSTSA